MRRYLKAGLLAGVSGVTRRRAVLLSAQADGRDPIFALRAPYRVDTPVLALHLDEPGAGRLTVTFRPRRGGPAWTSGAVEYHGPTTLSLGLGDGEVRLGARVLGRVGAGAVPHRRFSWHVRLETGGGVRRRTTGHYVARAGQPVDASYYSGEDYADYEAESAADRTRIVDLARRNGARGRVLDVGCATGGILASLGEAGFDAYGLDFSEWAVERARRRVGADRVWHCDVEREALPRDVHERAPFGLLVLASVLEHLARPFEVLQRLAALAAPGAILLVITSNAASLTHRVFGTDWEGYFDWTHLGVERITPESLRRELPALGWNVRELRTAQVWDGSDDPTHATLREWYASDARFERLLEERDLGDFITCVAVRA